MSLHVAREEAFPRVWGWIHWGDRGATKVDRHRRRVTALMGAYRGVNISNQDRKRMEEMIWAVIQRGRQEEGDENKPSVRVGESESIGEVRIIIIGARRRREQGLPTPPKASVVRVHTREAEKKGDKDEPVTGGPSNPAKVRKVRAELSSRCERQAILEGRRVHGSNPSGPATHGSDGSSIWRFPSICGVPPTES